MSSNLEAKLIVKKLEAVDFENLNVKIIFV